MKKSCTPNDFIFLTYCETVESDDQRLIDTLQTNEDVRQEFENDTKLNFGFDCSVSPSSRVLDNIMSYARALSVIKTKKVGHINLLMN